jgi:hypothetical protein
MEGTIMGRTLHQIFVKTKPSTLPNGMCGGPVLIPHQDIQMSIDDGDNYNNNKSNHSSSSKKIEQHASSGSSNGIGYSESSSCSTATTITTTTTTTSTNVSGKKKRQAVDVSKLSSNDGMEGSVRTPLAICGMIEGMIMIDCLIA